jgi:Alpha/beta hydrolase domain containing 18
MAGSAAYSTLERAILHRLAESTGRTIDLAYASIVHQLGINQRFFAEGGFGDLRVVDFHQELKNFQSWPPQHFDDVKIDWRRVREGNHNGNAYTVLRASFPTLARGPTYDAMPIESRTAHALWIVPHKPAPGSPTAVHLAATGDHGFARREHLAIPMVDRGVGSIALESPFYGLRKPAEQQGAKLRRVSDLLLLGKATIEESLFLLRWLCLRGHSRLGVSGLSMGGVHASMVAALYPEPLALTPLLAPRSAAQSYCHGALFHATAWDRLLRDTEGREAEIVAAVKEAAVANEKMAAAKIKRDALEGRMKTLELSLKLGVNKEIEGDKTKQVAAKTTASNFEEASENAQQQGHWAAVGRWMSDWGHSLENQLRKVRRLESISGTTSTKNNKSEKQSGDRHAAAVLLLEAVLETFTDATRFPCPRKPEAAILVAATEDAYVSPQSVLDLHRHLPGSEIRWRVCTLSFD